MDSLSRSLRRPIWDMLRYIFYRIECLKREKTDPYTKLVGLSFKDFFSQHDLIKPLHRSRDSQTAYSIGNLTFGKQHLSVHLSFTEKKDILLQKPNSNLILNKEIAEYSKWRDSQIREREKRLLKCLYEIWPSAENFSPKKVVGQSVKPTVQTTVNETSKAKTERRLVAMARLDEYQSVRFVMYTGEEELSEIEILNKKIIGMHNDNNKRTLEDQNILFACSALAWPEVEPYVKILDYVRREHLQPVQNQSEELNIEDWLLESAQNAQVLVVPVTRWGHILEGTIEDFDEEAIYMQIREHTVVVYRQGLYEFAVQELHQGIVTEFYEDRGYGFIQSGNLPRVFVHISEVSDPTIEFLQSEQTVEFDLNQTTKGEGLSAINVELVED